MSWVKIVKDRLHSIYYWYIKNYVDFEIVREDLNLEEWIKKRIFYITCIINKNWFLFNTFYLLWMITKLNNNYPLIHFNLVIITTNHIYIGAVYIMSGLIGGSIGFGLSIILRLELALPGFILCSSLQYNSNITYFWFIRMNGFINMNGIFYSKSYRQISLILAFTLALFNYCL